jgi:SAM-dependent methyltransferase
MAHYQQQQFFLRIKQQFPDKFIGCDVLDIGSLDINGNNRYLFEDYNYIGVDVGEGPNVDVVSKGHEYKSEKLFDVVISSECFEHDMYYEETIKNCILLTKPKGLFTFTCASTGRAEHGTKRTDGSWAAPLLALHDNDWSDYYKNLTESDIRQFINPDELFSEYYFEYEPSMCDLYFWGIKK